MSVIPKKWYSKILDLTGDTRPQVKTKLDNHMNNGWVIVTIYTEGTEVRAVLIRETDR